MSEEDELEADLARTAVVAADLRLPEIYLVVHGGQLAGRRFRLHKQRIVIGAGRGANNEINIDIPTLSARHAAVELSRDGTVLLWDLKSSNGTYLNDQAIAPGTGYRVNRGDTVRLGPDLVFTLRHSGDGDEVSSVTAARGAIGSGEKRPRRKESGTPSTAARSTPPGISSDVPLGKILGYLISGGIVVCTLFGLLNDAFDFVGLVKGFFGAAG